MKLTSETFVLPWKDSYMVYIPTRRILMRADRSTVASLALLMKEDCDCGQDQPLFRALHDAGAINGHPEQPFVPTVAKDYSPTHATLMLTSRCNLGCQYCYAEANKEILKLPLELGYAAIDLVARNAAAKGMKMFEMSFHGGGEPTIAWDEMVEFHRYAKALAASLGMQVRASTITNGCIRPAQARWITENFQGATLSWDGPPDIQDKQRPTVGGQASSALVQQTAKIFDEGNFSYGIQATVTTESTPRMPEMVRFFARHAKTRKVKFEPVSSTGRCKDKEELAPSLEEFAHWFNEAWDVAQTEGVELLFSAATRLFELPTCYFCGALSHPFSVTPDGYVSACYEVCSRGKEFEDIFILGHYDHDTGKFVIEQEKLARLRSRSVNNMDACKKCFCKYSCAGDCPSRNMRMSQGPPNLFANGQRCDAIREITRHQLGRHLEKQEANALQNAGEA